MIKKLLLDVDFFQRQKFMKKFCQIVSFKKLCKPYLENCNENAYITSRGNSFLLRFSASSW